MATTLAPAIAVEGLEITMENLTLEENIQPVPETPTAVPSAPAASAVEGDEAADTCAHGADVPPVPENTVAPSPPPIPDSVGANEATDKLTNEEDVHPAPATSSPVSSLPAASTVDVEAILSQLTLQEKVSLLAGNGLWNTAPIERLGVPSVKVSDGPNGARGTLFMAGTKAACFPAAVSIAATWDSTLARRIGIALAEEAKTKGASALLAPTVCLHRSPLGGRNFETFSEDPLLTGLQAAALIGGLQEHGVAATIKHYVGNEQETMRNTVDVVVGERPLREIYLKPFEIAIKKSKPLALMTSYNRVNGAHTDHSTHLLKEILREQWGYNGLVMSDYGGTNSLEDSIKAGLDLEMPGPPVYRKIEEIEKSISGGSLDMESIDRRALSVLNFVKRTGRFEHPEDAPEQAIDNPAHRALIREAAGNGVVLLKNSNNALPLKRDILKSVAVLGQAKECLAHGGGSAGLNAHYNVTPYDALQNALGDAVELRYAKGAQVHRKLPGWTRNVTNLEGQPGFTLQEYATTDISNATPERSYAYPLATFMAIESKPQLVRLNGVFKPATSGAHYFSLLSLGHAKFFIDDELVYDAGPEPHPHAFALGGEFEVKKQFQFKQGREYRLRVEVLAPPPEQAMVPLMAGRIALHVGFMPQAEYEEDVVGTAVEAAKSADVALVFVGNTAEWESEGRDALTMNLPANGSQDRLISAVASVNPNTIVINSTGVPIAMPWIDDVSGVLQLWFAGQESGNAIVDVLLGTVSPSGKLPVSFPRTLEDNPSFCNFPGDTKTQTVRYEEGLGVGYRYYDKRPWKALFSFGFGLTYAQFRIGQSVLSAEQLAHGSLITVKVDIKNIGDIEGKEVIQVYIAPAGSDAVRPIKTLAGFTKVNLAPGASTSAEVEVSFESAAYWNETKDCWTVDQGKYEVLVGNSSSNVTRGGVLEVVETFHYGP